MKHIVTGVRRFQQHLWPRLSDHFEKLAGGQSPEVLFITCSDSRIDPSLITQTEPGELFIVRNAGNITPVYGEDDGAAASIEYAVAALKVRHIVVCGHSGCGAIGGALSPEGLVDVPAVARWIKHATPSVKAVSALDPKDKLHAAIRHNASHQLENLRSHPSVAAALERKAITLHAWIYDIHSGNVDEVATFGEIQEESA